MKKILLLVMIMLTLLSCSEIDENSEVYLNPDVTSIEISQEIKIDLHIENINKVFSASGKIGFDRTKLQFKYDSFTYSDLWGLDPIFFYDIIDENIEFCISLKNSSDIVSIHDTGIILTFYLEGIREGIGSVYLSELNLLDDEGKTIFDYSETDISAFGVTIIGE